MQIFLPGISTTYQDNGVIVDGQWGRKSAMTVDPVDDACSWYTNQYYNDSHQAWRISIGWFRFPTCKAGTTARIPPYQRDPGQRRLEIPWSSTASPLPTAAAGSPLLDVLQPGRQRHQRQARRSCAIVMPILTASSTSPGR